MGNAFCELQKAFPESFTEKPGRQNSSGPAAREEAFMTVAPPLTDAGIEVSVYTRASPTEGSLTSVSVLPDSSNDTS